MRRILLQDKSMVDTVRLRPTGADLDVVGETGPHGRMEGSGDVRILIQPGTAAQDFGEPELSHGSLHVADLALGRDGGSDPLGWFSSHSADHVGMGEGAGGRPLTPAAAAVVCRRRIEGRRNWLGDSTVQGGCSAWDSGRWIVIAAFSGCWTEERRTVSKGGHIRSSQSQSIGRRIPKVR